MVTRISAKCACYPGLLTRFSLHAVMDMKPKSIKIKSRREFKSLSGQLIGALELAVRSSGTAKAYTFTGFRYEKNLTCWSTEWENLSCWQLSATLVKHMQLSPTLGFLIQIHHQQIKLKA